MSHLKENRPESSEKATFPFVPVVIVLLLSTLLLVGLGLRLRYAYQEFENVTEVDFKLQGLRGSIIHLDEVLTMSARMAAATGDLSWEARYFEHVPLLDDALAKTQSLMPETFVAEGTSQTDKANQVLIDLETRAFDKTRAGDLIGAQDLLSSDQYQTQKRVYADGMEMLMEGLIDHNQRDIELRQSRLLVDLALLLVAALSIVFVVVLVLRSMSRYTTRLHEQVHLRTLDLEASNERLQGEIGERKQAESELLESKRLFDALAEQSRTVTWEADSEGLYTFVSENSTSVLGYAPDELVGKLHFYDIHPEEGREAFKALALERVVHKRHFDGFENTVETKSGELLWVSTFGVPVLDEAGDLIGYRGSDTDVTARRLAEDAIKQERHRLASIIDGTNIATWEWHLKTGEVLFNERWAEIIGYTLGEISPVSIDTWKRFCHPDDFRKSGEFLEKHFSGELRFYDCEARMRHKDGSWVWVHDRGKVVSRSEDGEALVMMGTHSDISERKRIEEQHRLEEEKFRGLFERSPVGIAMNDAETGDFILFNDSFLEPTGYIREEFEKVSYWDITPSEYAEQEEEQLRQLKQMGYYGPYEKEYVRKDGQRYPVLLNGFLSQTVDGKQVIWSIVQDISNRKQAELELQEINDHLTQQTDYANAMAVEAQAANQAKSAFLATMSHEIRTPMNAVIGMTSLLLHSNLSAEQREYAETIRTSGGALLSLINDILDFSKIESGKTELEESTFDLSDCIVEPLDIISARARENRIQLSYEIDANAPSSLVGDASRIKQILLNLLSNAVKFSDEESGVVLAVSCRDLDDGRCELTCEVQDSGIGISEEAGRHLFNPFVQADNTITRRFGGTGLGLAISKRLAEMMGGDLVFRSQVGEGTTFSLSIPLRRGVIRKTIFERDETFSLRGKKILIVGGNDAALQSLESSVRGWGMDVITSCEASGALDVATRFSPDVILVDFTKGDSSLLEFGERIRSRNTRNTRMFLCVAQGGDKADIKDNLFDRVLRKPIGQSALHNALLESLDGPEAPLTKGRRASGSREIDVTLAESYPLRILVAEDNRTNQRVISILLGKMGYHADIVSDGQEAVEAIQRQVYDLILMDLEMPRMNGYDATNAIRGMLPSEKLPTIAALTANVSGNVKASCLAHGMAGYLSKPIQLEALTQMIKSASEARRGPADPS